LLRTGVPITTLSPTTSAISHADAGDAQGGGAMVADQPTGKADQDRRQGGEPGRYVTFQMAEVAVPQQMFQDILRLIARLRAPPAPA